jgi:hypothetical protein
MRKASFHDTGASDTSARAEILLANKEEEYISNDEASASLIGKIQEGDERRRMRLMIFFCEEKKEKRGDFCIKNMLPK